MFEGIKDPGNGGTDVTYEYDLTFLEPHPDTEEATSVLAIAKTHAGPFARLG